MSGRLLKTSRLLPGSFQEVFEFAAKRVQVPYGTPNGRHDAPLIALQRSLVRCDMGPILAGSRVGQRDCAPLLGRPSIDVLPEGLSCESAIQGESMPVSEAGVQPLGSQITRVFSDLVGSNALFFFGGRTRRTKPSSDVTPSHHVTLSRSGASFAIFTG